jgi:hypothetical protein
MPRLPLAPPVRPDEALSSWVARIAARYDLSAFDLVRHLLPKADDVAEMLHWLDYRPVAPLEAALVDVAGQPAVDVRGHRLTDPAMGLESLWPRRQLAWCPLCAIADVATSGEVYRRVTWMLGGVLLCTRHQCLLTTACPCCFHQAGYQPVNGRLRIWCQTCRAGADSALPPGRIPFWPYGTPQQRRHCGSVSLSAEARPLLQRVQTDSLALLAGAQPTEPWTRYLKPPCVLAVLRRLVFVMLGPLGETSQQVRHVAQAENGHWMLSATWSPGLLLPEIAAPALLAAVTFLAAESGTPLHGITWDRRRLLPGEADSITAETLLRHLDDFNAALVQDLFAAPFTRPFAGLLAALRSDGDRLGSARAARRRPVGMSIPLCRQPERRRQPAPSRVPAHNRPLLPQAGKAPSRAARSRLTKGFPAPPARVPPRATWPEAAAVETVLGWQPEDGDILAPPGDWAPPLLHNRYVRLWIHRHRHWPADLLIATLVSAVDTARRTGCDIVLPAEAAVDGLG